MITKNKKEIKWIKERIKTFKKENVDTYALTRELKATIKTSIDWCEDEIKFLENIIFVCKSCRSDKNYIGYEDVQERIKQLITHLEYLKKEKQNEI